LIKLGESSADVEVLNGVTDVAAAEWLADQCLSILSGDKARSVFVDRMVQLNGKTASTSADLVPPPGSEAGFEK
jgi:hypothetical protein